MHWFHKVLIIGAIVTVLTVALIQFNVNLVYIFVASSLATLILGALSFYKKEKKNQLTEQFNKLFEEYIKEKEKHRIDEEIRKGEINHIKQEIESEKIKSRRLTKMVDNIGVTLTKENISKEEIIRNITTPLKTIIFQKYWEDPVRKRYIIRDKVYPKIHAHHIKGGLRIIPAGYVPQDKSNDEIIKWFRKELEENIPPDYEYNIDFITIVNLTDIKSFKRLGNRYERGHFDWLRNVPTKEIAPPDMIMNYLATKKDLSTRDIIEIPNIMFLVDDSIITLQDKAVIKNKGDEIIKDIKKFLRIKELKTTDLANIDDKELTLILSEFGIKRPLIISEMLIRNAKLWKIILDRKLIQG